MRRKYSSVELTEQRMALTVIKTSEETYKKCMERLRSMEIPKGWQVEVCTVQGGCAAGARNSGMKAVNAPIKAYMEDRLQLCDKGALRKVVETFVQYKDIGVVGLWGTNEIPVSGIAQNSWQLLGERAVGDGILKGEKLAEITDCLAIDGAFMAFRGDTIWHEDIYKGEIFYDTAQTLDWRRKGYRTVIIPQSETPVFLGGEKRTATEKAQNCFLDEYSKDIFPLVSIIIPTYCRPDYFKEALDSALGQTYRNIEVFITDNSPDTRTADLIARKYAGDSRVHYEHHPEYKGGGQNWRRARAYNNAKAEYVQWLMDDDILLPHKIEVMVEGYRRNPHVALITSYRKLIDEEGNELPDLSINVPLAEKDKLYDGKIIGKNILTNMMNFIGEPSTVLIKKKCLHNGDLGWTGKEGRALISDFPTWLNLCEQGDVLYLHEPASLFRLHGSNGQDNPNTLYCGLVCWALMIIHAWEKKVFLENEADLDAAVNKWFEETMRIREEYKKRNWQTEWEYTLRQFFCRMSELFVDACSSKKRILDYEA